MQTKYTPWVKVDGRLGWENNPLGITAYRIWLQTNGREWWQRHEWQYADKKNWLEAWIDSSSKSFPNHYIDVAEEDLDLILKGI